jgi:hypothetical protein
MRAPAVYQFVCPDGRVYIGSRANVLARKREGITATNSRLAAALAVYPAETWAFEVLEQLPGGCSKAIRLRAEQQYIDRLRSWDPTCGFNMNPADRSVASPACTEAYRRRMRCERRGLGETENALGPP